MKRIIFVVITMMALFTTQAQTIGSAKIDSSYSKEIFMGRPYIFLTTISNEFVSKDTSWEIHTKPKYLAVPIIGRTYLQIMEHKPFIELPVGLFDIHSDEISILIKNKKITKVYPRIDNYSYWGPVCLNTIISISEKKTQFSDFKYEIITLRKFDYVTLYSIQFFTFICIVILFVALYKFFVKSEKWIGVILGFIFLFSFFGEVYFFHIVSPTNNFRFLVNIPDLGLIAVLLIFFIRALLMKKKKVK